MVDLVKLVKGFYGAKDLKKFKVATQLISRGANGSSSHRYSPHHLANTGHHSRDDIVGISVNGNRRGRLRADFKEIHKAHDAGVRGFVTDNVSDRARDFNIGEREVAKFLTKLGYVDPTNKGHWVLASRIKK